MSHKKGEFLFKKWIELENYKEKMIEAVENSSPDFPQYLLEYVSLATRIPYKHYEQADWLKIILLFYACLVKSPTIKLPLTTPTRNKPEKDEPWHYENRTWHLYSHLIAKTYGWGMKEISHLKVFDALAIIQEVLVDEQLDREFYYGLSEIAYPYDKNTKKSIFKPLDRPYWMRPKLQPIPRFKIPKSVMPVGLIMMDNVLPNEYLPKEIVH